MSIDEGRVRVLIPTTTGLVEVLLLWATGSVRTVDLTVGSVGHIPEKFSISMDRLKQEAAAGRPVVAVIPSQNSAVVTPEIESDLAANGIDLIELSQVHPLWEKLAIMAPKAARKVTQDHAPSIRPPQPDPVSSSAGPLPGRTWIWRRAKPTAVGAIVGLALVFVGLIINFELTGKSVSDWIGEDGAVLLFPVAAFFGGGMGMLLASRKKGQ